LTSFTDFGLSAPILKALETEGYTTPTPIQTQAIPPGLAGRDILGIAQTGTGKTAAFALPILERLLANKRSASPRGCRVLVLAPTRELASQIADSFHSYARNSRITGAVVFGGVSIGQQERRMAPGVDILVATPGRLLDLIDRRSLSIRDIEILVLDEADQMLDLGFIHALKRIVAMLPKERQTMFFSATMPKTIAGLADSFLTDPVKVAVAPVATTAERVDQSVMFVPQQKKQAVLHKVLEDETLSRVLIFARTKHGSDRVVRHLAAAGHNAAAIHGNKSQAQRERALASFKEGRCRILVATDIAARGIDVDGVSHVINFELPNVPESYVHRIGRTARAGKAGIALSFCADDERPYLRDIERLTRQRVFVLPVPEGVDYAAVKAAAVSTSDLVDDRGDRRDDRRGRPSDGRNNRRDGGHGHAAHGERHHGGPRGGGRPAPNGPAATVAQGQAGRDGAPRGERRDGAAPRGERRPEQARQGRPNQNAGQRPSRAGRPRD
jgi:ATP-dependent RNA helicase RhlE